MFPRNSDGRPLLEPEADVGVRIPVFYLSSSHHSQQSHFELYAYDPHSGLRRVMERWPTPLHFVQLGSGLLSKSFVSLAACLTCGTSGHRSRFLSSHDTILMA